MSRIIISGYYGMQNTGDDAFSAVTSWGVNKYLKATEVLIHSSRSPEFKNSQYVHPVYVKKTRFKGQNKLRYYYNVLRSKSIVFGGGSIFHSSDILRKQIELLRLSGKGPHAALGVSIGPFRDSKAEMVCADLLKRLSFVGLRDKHSLDIARSIAPDVRSEKTFDLAVMLPRAEGYSVDSFNNGVYRRGIGVALCNYERYTGGDSKREEVRKKKIVKMLKQLDPEENEEIVFIDFNGHHYFGDRDIHSEIIAEMGDHIKIRHIPYSSNPMKVLKVISGLRIIIAMRLHAAVFGYISQTPTIMLSYHPKCIDWANEIGMPQDFIFDSHDFDINQVALCIKETISKDPDKATLSAMEAEKLAMKNWLWINE